MATTFRSSLILSGTLLKSGLRSVSVTSHINLVTLPALTNIEDRPVCKYLHTSNIQFQNRYYSTDGSRGGAEQQPEEDVEAKVRQNIADLKSGSFESSIIPEDLKHFRNPSTVEELIDPTRVPNHPRTKEPDGSYNLPHPIWSEAEVDSIRITHKKPDGFIDKMAYYSVYALRAGYDMISGYNRRERDERMWLNRVCFLETVAGVPGMVAAMVRHLHSLRRLRRDHGWIHTLLEEAENERMHLMTAMQLKNPSFAFRATVMGAQGAFVTFFSFAYLICPRYCHRLVGYLEEEAVVTYSKLLNDIDTGIMQHWKTQPAPKLAVKYWTLEPLATMRDVILAIRADEAHHRIVNHTLASMKPDDLNPYKPGE